MRADIGAFSGGVSSMTAADIYGFEPVYDDDNGLPYSEEVTSAEQAGQASDNPLNIGNIPVMFIVGIVALLVAIRVVYELK